MFPSQRNLITLLRLEVVEGWVTAELDNCCMLAKAYDGSINELLIISVVSRQASLLSRPFVF